MTSEAVAEKPGTAIYLVKGYIYRNYSFAKCAFTTKAEAERFVEEWGMSGADIWEIRLYASCEEAVGAGEIVGKTSVGC